MGLLQNVIRNVVITALGAKLARGRSPIVGALMGSLHESALSVRLLGQTQNSSRKQRWPLPQRPERAGTRLILGAPDVIARQADVLPAERRDVAE